MLPVERIVSEDFMKLSDFIQEPEVTYKTGKNRLEVLDQLVSQGLHVYATGSRVTTHFDPDKSDYDYVVLDDEKWLSHVFYAEHDQWYTGNSGNQYSTFQSLKKEMKDSSQVVNLIFVNSKDMFMKYVMATDLIRKVDPETKKERVELFDLVFKNTEALF